MLERYLFIVWIVIDYDGVSNGEPRPLIKITGHGHLSRMKKEKKLLDGN